MKMLLEISLTNACPSKCGYCIADGTRNVHYDRFGEACGGKDASYLSPAECLDFVKQAMDAHGGEVVIALTGGEPMAHPAFECFVEMIGFMKLNTLAKLVVYSNLKLLNEARIATINASVDLLIAGYHPDQDIFSGERKISDTDKEWLKGQLSRLKIPCVVNYVNGAYSSEEDSNEAVKKQLDEFMLWAKDNSIPVVKTPRNQTWRREQGDIDIQLRAAPDMLMVRADGTIIKCKGHPDPVGSIYENGYSPDMRCAEGCSLCPSFWPFFGNEKLFE